MHSRVIRIRKLGLLTVRPLENRDTATVAALFDRPGQLASAELAQLATVDSRHHGLVAYVDGDPRPAGVGQLVRDAAEWTRGEIALAVADRYQGHAVGSTLAELLTADARAAGIRYPTGAECPAAQRPFMRRPEMQKLVRWCETPH